MFDDHINSGSTLIYLYHYTIGGVSHFYTDGLGLTYAGIEYFETNGTLNKIIDTSEIKKSDVTIQGMTENSYLAQEIKTVFQLAKISLTVFVAFAEDVDEEKRFLWAGDLVNRKNSMGKVDLVFRADAQRIGANGLYYTLSPRCQHQLYGVGTPSCNLDRALFTASGTVTSQTGKTIVVAEAALQADGYYSAGILKHGNNEVRIFTHVGSSLTIANQYTVEAGDAVEISAGCNHTYSRCAELGNDDNYSGCTTIPSVNYYTESSVI